MIEGQQGFANGGLVFLKECKFLGERLQNFGIFFKGLKSFNSGGEALFDFLFEDN